MYSYTTLNYFTPLYYIYKQVHIRKGNFLTYWLKLVWYFQPHDKDFWKSLLRIYLRKKPQNWFQSRSYTRTDTHTQGTIIRRHVNQLQISWPVLVSDMTYNVVTTWYRFIFKTINSAHHSPPWEYSWRAVYRINPPNECFTAIKA